MSSPSAKSNQWYFNTLKMRMHTHTSWNTREIQLHNTRDFKDFIPKCPQIYMSLLRTSLRSTDLNMLASTLRESVLDGRILCFLNPHPRIYLFILEKENWGEGGTEGGRRKRDRSVASHPGLDQGLRLQPVGGVWSGITLQLTEQPGQG